MSKIVLYVRPHVRKNQGLPLNFVTTMAGVYGKMILKRIFKKWDGEAWTGLIWFRIGAGGGLL